MLSCKLIICLKQLNIIDINMNSVFLEAETFAENFVAKRVLFVLFCLWHQREKGGRDEKKMSASVGKELRCFVWDDYHRHWQWQESYPFVYNFHLLMSDKMQWRLKMDKGLSCCVMSKKRNLIYFPILVSYFFCWCLF